MAEIANSVTGVFQVSDVNLKIDLYMEKEMVNCMREGGTA